MVSIGPTHVLKISLELGGRIRNRSLEKVSGGLFDLEGGPPVASLRRGQRLLAFADERIVWYAKIVALKRCILEHLFLDLQLDLPTLAVLDFLSG